MQVGPTASRPGPMLFIVAATAVKPVTRPVSSSSTMSSRDITNTSTKDTIYTFTARTTSWLTCEPSMVILRIWRGCTICRSSLPMPFTMMIMRDTFMPPPVEPAQAPMNIMVTSSTLEKLGHRSKSAVTKPVVEMTDDTVNSTLRKHSSSVGNISLTLRVIMAVTPMTTARNTFTSRVNAALNRLLMIK